jgi:hypothetical protein
MATPPVPSPAPDGPFQTDSLLVTVPAIRITRKLLPGSPIWSTAIEGIHYGINLMEPDVMGLTGQSSALDIELFESLATRIGVLVVFDQLGIRDMSVSTNVIFLYYISDFQLF